MKIAGLRKKQQFFFNDTFENIKHTNIQYVKCNKHLKFYSYIKIIGND